MPNLHLDSASVCWALVWTFLRQMNLGRFASVTGSLNSMRSELYSSSSTQSDPPSEAEVFANLVSSGSLATSIDYNWGTSAILGKVAAPAGLKISGYLNVSFPGQYMFCMGANDGALLWINDAMVVNAWSVDETIPPTSRCASSSVSLVVGAYRFDLFYRQKSLSAALSLSWKCDDCSPAIALAVIPADRFIADPGTAGSSAPIFIACPFLCYL